MDLPTRVGPYLHISFSCSTFYTKNTIYMTNFLVNQNQLTEHLQIIRKVSWNLHLQTGYDQEDLFSEGCLQYLLKRKKFDEKREIKFTTFIWTTIHRLLLNYIRDNSKVVLEVQEAEYLPSYKKHQIVDKFECCAY